MSLLSFQCFPPYKLDRKIYKLITVNPKGFGGGVTCLKGLQKTTKNFNLDSQFLLTHLTDIGLEHCCYISLLSLPLEILPTS
jgi:hypothetical protein